MRLLILSILFTFSFNFSISQEDNYKGLLTDFIKAQGQFETFNATIDQMTSMMGVTLNEYEKVDKGSKMWGMFIDFNFYEFKPERALFIESFGKAYQKKYN